MLYILFYQAEGNYVERRAPYRSEHLQLAAAAHATGDLPQAGALAEPADGAVFVFRTREAAAQFAQDDPYVVNGVVKHWSVRPWTVVIGSGADPVSVPR